MGKIHRKKRTRNIVSLYNSQCPKREDGEYLISYHIYIVFHLLKFSVQFLNIRKRGQTLRKRIQKYAIVNHFQQNIN